MELHIEMTAIIPSHHLGRLWICANDATVAQNYFWKSAFSASLRNQTKPLVSLFFFNSLKLHHSIFSLAIWPTTQAYPETYKISLAVLKDKGIFKEGRLAANKDDQNNLVGTSGCQYLTSLSSIAEFGSSLEMDVLPLCGALLFPTLRSHGLHSLQAPLSMESSRQEYWSGLPCPLPGGLPDPEIEHVSPALAGRFSTSEPPGKPECS